MRKSSPAYNSLKTPEDTYKSQADKRKVKSLGQFFTPDLVADYMASWVSPEARTLLDPAAGNGVLLRYAQKYTQYERSVGYEIDPDMIKYFNLPELGEIRQADFLNSPWDETYDFIIANPPYNRFQSMENRKKLYEQFSQQTGIQFSRYTNQAVLFLIKAIHQLADNGRLAFIMPYEFLNSKYGDAVKSLLIKQQLLHTLVSFGSAVSLFDQAVTTSCIILLEKKEKTKAVFYEVDTYSPTEKLAINPLSGRSISYDQLEKTGKWHTIMNKNQLPGLSGNQISDTCGLELINKIAHATHLVSLNHAVTVSRGLATGANHYFLFSQEKATAYHLPETFLTPCLTRSSQAKHCVFTRQDFQQLKNSNQKIYILDIPATADKSQVLPPSITTYLELGLSENLNQNYLLSHRNPWFSMEKKSPAPIWISAACRSKLKVIRNLAGICQLTTFHGIYIKDEFSHLTNIIFCYLLTPLAQQLIFQNRKIMGNGLSKYQPNDMNHALSINFASLTKKHIRQIEDCYQQLLATKIIPVEKLQRIFLNYL